MHLLKMEGAWGPFSAWAYSRVVADGAQQLFERVAHELAPPLAEGAIVLDVGCGEGQVCSLLAARYPGARVVGVDSSRAMLRRARRRGPLSNLAFLDGDATDLPLPDRSVDVVLSVGSIKHWPDRLRGLREIQRVLRPRGATCIVEVNRECTGVDALSFARRWRYLPPGTRSIAAAYFRRVVAGQSIDGATLHELMHQAGLEQIRWRRVEGLPYVVAWGNRR